MLSIDNTVLVIIDVQEKLLRVMSEKEKLVENLRKLIQGARVLGIPIVMTEQYPAGLGPTVPEIAELLPDIKPISKFSFSCCGEAEFLKQIQNTKRQQILITGIETHVCVYQTAVELLDAGHEVQIVAECVSSRTPENKEVGIEKVLTAGGELTSVETALFELLKVAKGDKFKEISRIIK